MDAGDIFKKLSVGAFFRHLPRVKSKNVQIKSEEKCSKVPSTEPKKSKESAKLLKEDIMTVMDGFLSSENSEEKNKKRSRPSDSKLEKEEVAHLRNKHRIAVLGKNVAKPIDDFDSLKSTYNLAPCIVDNLFSCGYSAPTPIQMQVVPLMLEGRQVLACAPTGSGKTAAFLLPIIHHLGGPKGGGFRAVIVCPTRELAAQTYRHCERFSAGTKLRSLLISKVSHVKGSFNAKAVAKTDILITTPNRLVYLLQQDPPLISLKKVEWLVVDECDKLFEAGIRGFRDQLAIIYTACDSATVKRAMFSATQSPHLTRWCRRNLRNLVTVNVGVRGSACSDVEQELVFVGNEAGKLVALRDLVARGLTPPVLVFVQSKERAQELFNELIYDGINVDVIHSDRTVAQRDNVVRCFREGKIWVLICTELMGRGIDFKGVNLVVNYDFPPSAVAYIHRIGRTGRAGRRGRAVTFFTLGDTNNLRSVARVVRDSGGDVPDYMLAMRKLTKFEKKQLESHAPDRESISTTPIYQEMKERKKRNAIKRTKRLKASKSIAADSSH